MGTSSLTELWPAVLDGVSSRAFAAAAGRVHQLGGTDPRLFGEKPDPELLAARLEQRILRIGILREQPRHRRRRTQRAVRIGAAGELRPAPSLLCRQPDGGKDHHCRKHPSRLLFHARNSIAAPGPRAAGCGLRR
jgi:hypothetical protein